MVRKYWTEAKPLTKRIVTAISTLAAIVGIYTGLATFMGVELRPAWVWEHDALRHEITEVHISQQQANLREYNRTLNEYRAIRENFRLKEAPIPDWLIGALSDSESDVTATARLIDRLQKRLLAMETD